MQPPQQYTAKLQERTDHNDKYIEFHFELLEPHRMAFAAGQYVSVKATDAGMRRSYSIISSPAVDHGFGLLVDVEPNGPGAQLFKQLQPGGSIEFLGPLGRFMLAEKPEEEAIVLIATGSGIAPFRSMVFDLLQVRRDPRPIYLYWGMRFVEQLFWLEEFQQLGDAFSNFHFHPVISKPVPEWTLCRGRVTDCLTIHQLPANAGYYICGNASMIQDTSQLLLQKGVPHSSMYHEKFH